MLTTVATGIPAASTAALLHPPKLSYRPKELPGLTGISLRSINRAMSTGQLKARKVGRITIIMADDLAAFLASAPSR